MTKIALLSFLQWFIMCITSMSAHNFNVYAKPAVIFSLFDENLKKLNFFKTIILAKSILTYMVKNSMFYCPDKLFCVFLMYFLFIAKEKRWLVLY